LDFFQRRRRQGLLDASHSPLGKGGLFVVDDGDRLLASGPVEHAADESGNQWLKHRLHDVIVQQPGPSLVRVRPRIVQFLQRANGRGGTVELAQLLDLGEERIDGWPEPTSAIGAQNVVGRNDEVAPMLCAERVGAGSAQFVRQRFHTRVWPQAQALSVGRFTEEKVENPAEDEAGFVSEVNPGTSMNRFGWAEKLGDHRSVADSK
jgi:hypothetical protein